MFKLLQLKFDNHPFFGKIDIDFVDEDEQEAINYITLIIGPNGTGKSQILLSIISIFNSLENLKLQFKKYTFPYYYHIKFLSNGLPQDIKFDNNGLALNGNTVFDGDQEDMILPAKMMVSAFSFNDKYPLRENRGKIINNNYYYLGLKSTTNNIFIYTPPKNAILLLSDALRKGKDISPLKEAFLTLDLKPQLTILYKPGRNYRFFQSSYILERMNERFNFRDLFTQYLLSKNRKRAVPELKRLGNEKVEKILGDDQKMENLINFLTSYGREFMAYKKEIPFRANLDFDDQSTFRGYISVAEPLQTLSDLEIISFDRFEINKLDRDYSFDDASSGEYHIILTFLNILSIIEENSLIMLDEPEISLHPNWQIKYMDIFNKIFNRFQNCHFVIVTHSHFLVSDLKSENSNIIAADFNADKKISLTSVTKDTYGWSAEQILLDVFKVGTTRNYFLTKTITDILKEIAKKDVDYNLVREKLEVIVSIDISNFNEHDPMRNIFREMIKLYDEIK